MTEPDSAGKSAGGEIIEHLANWFQVRVRLDDGRQIEAVIPKTRRWGCLFGQLIGWRVEVTFRNPPKMHRVVELRRPVAAALLKDEPGADLEP